MNEENLNVQDAGNEVCRVIVSGSLDILKPAEAAAQLVLELYPGPALPSDSEHLQLDLAACPSIKARAVAFLICLRRQLRDVGVDWSIINAPPILARTLGMLSLETSFHVVGPQVHATNACSRSIAIELPSNPSSDDPRGRHFEIQIMEPKS